MIVLLLYIYGSIEHHLGEDRMILLDDQHSPNALCRHAERIRRGKAYSLSALRSSFSQLILKHLNCLTMSVLFVLGTCILIL